MRQLKTQLLHLLPTFLFFFLFFNLLNITTGLIEGTDQIGYFSFLSVFFASLIVAKVLALIDHLPFVDVFPGRPLIYNVTWKTFLYTLTSFLIRLLEHFILKGKYNFSPKDAALLESSWLTFWTVQVWFFVLFLLYTLLRKLIQCIGAEKARRMFFTER
jgi:hypothetical protein